MSQVIRKFKSGGQQPELFERKGVGKYNKQELVAGLYKGIDSYIKDNNLTGDQAVSFRNLADNFIKGIESGTITLNSNGTFSDSTGKISSTGTFDKNLFGKVKNTENNIYNLVGDYALNYINSMPQYQSPAPTTKGRFNANELLSKEISKRWYGGKDIDFENWFKNRSEQDRNQLIGDIFNNLDYNKLFQDYDWTDTGVNSVEDLTSRGKAFGSAILNNTLDNDDYNRFAELGGSNLDKFFKYEQKTPDQEKQERQDALRKSWEEEAKQKGYTSEESIQAYVESRQRELDQKEQTLIDENQKAKEDLARNQYFEKYKQENPFRQTIRGGIIPTTSNEQVEAFEKYIKDLAGNYSINDYMNSNLSKNQFKSGNYQNIANQLDYLMKMNFPLPDAGNGFVALPSTFDWSNYSAVIYNPTTRQFMETSMLANDALRKLADDYYNKNILKRKEGGVLYMQFGGTYDVDSYSNIYTAKKSQEDKAKKQQEAKDKGITVEQVEAGNRKPGTDSKDWKYEDWARLVSAGADIGSMIAAFAPGYGTAASAGLGLTSTLGNLTADLADKRVSLNSAFGNAALGLGMDIVGLVPGFGIAGKGSKIAKNLIKLAPLLTTIWSTAASYNPAKNALEKLQSKGVSELTVEDWRALGNGIAAIAGGTRFGASVMKNSKFKDRYGIKTHTVTTKSGKQIEMSDEEFKRIQRASGIEGQNEALKAIKGAENEELSTTFKRKLNPKRIWQGTPKTSTKVTIDTDALKRTTSDGTIQVPTKYSNRGIWEMLVNNKFGSNWKNPSWMKNLGYTSVKNSQATTPIRPVEPTKSQVKQYKEKNKPINTSLRNQIDKNLGITNYNLTGNDINTKAYNRVKEKEYQKIFDEADAKALRRINSKAVIKNKREQYSNDMADITIALNYWRKRFPKRTSGLSDNDLLDLIKQQKTINNANFKDGGVLFLQKGQPVRSNVQTLNPNYSRADFLGSNDVLNYFRSIKDANDVAAFNQREDIYDNEYTKAYGAGSLKNWDSNTHLTTVAPNWGTGTLQGLWSKTGLNPYLWSNMSQGYGKTGDNPEGPYPDQIFGDITYQRTLGRGITPQLVQQANEILKDKGYKYEADPIHGGYRITPISKISVAPKRISIATEDPKIQEFKKLRDPSTLYPNNNSDNKSNIKINPEDVLAAGRMIGGLVANNRAAALYKEGLKPTLLDTFENYVPLQGNTPAKQSAYQQAANIESLAAMPRTSDASLQLAGELDASSKAAQARFQGDLADAEMYYKTRMLGQQESDAAKARRVDVANKNKAAMNAIAAAKKQIDASKVSANYQQVIAPWLAGIENLYRQNKAVKQQLAVSNYLNQNASTYDTKLDQIMETYKNDPVKQQEAIRTLQTQAQKDLLEEKSKLVGSPWLISYGKSGTKLSYKDRAKLQQAKDFNKRLSDDNKQFHKDIMESKREHNKLIMNLSALTAALIKRGMQL